MSAIGDLLGRLFGRRAAAPAPAPAPAAAAPDDAAWLAAHLGRLAADAAARDEAWQRVDALVAAGHTRLAAEWLDKLAAALPPSAGQLEAHRRSARLHLDRGEDDEARPHLAALLAAAPDAETRFELAELDRRAGRHDDAAAGYEAVLALDVDHSRAAARLAAIRATPAPAAAHATLPGPEAMGAGARYRLLRELGRGACGAVYLAHDDELDRDVAVKLLHAHLAGPALERFFAEARTTAALRHPNIVAVLDLDEEHRRIVLEHAAGGTLADRLARGPLAVAVALRRHAELLDALAAAHRHDVCHLDLKPQNLLFRLPGDDAAAVLADFGVAHLAGRGDAAAGTLLYMAPEVRAGAVAHPAADVYSAALLLWESLVGRPPLGPEQALRGEAPSPTLPIESPLRSAVEEHLARLAAADPAARPTASEALHAARALVDRAVLLEAPVGEIEAAVAAR